MTVLLGFTLPLFALGMVLMAAGSRSQAPRVQLQRARKLIVFAVIVHAVLAIILLLPLGASGLALALVFAGGRELRGAARSLPRRLRIPVFAIATAVAALFLLDTWLLGHAAIAFCFLVSAGFDGFCQVIGQWLGRRPLMPRISPAKTVEGLLGGVLASLALAAALRDFVDLSVASALIAGGATAGGAFCGDTVGSWVKRKAGIKDFSSVLPGHGGVVDRFGSFAVGLVSSTPWWLSWRFWSP